MAEKVADGKLVELTYQVIDQKTEEVLIQVEYPIGYVHGVNDILSEPVMKELNNCVVGDVIEVPIDCNILYGERDENLVFTDFIDNVPEEYREVGLTITMENDKGEPRDFLVTRVDEKSVTIDGNNPLCGRHVVFKLEVLSVRDATEEEIEAGGPVDAEPDLNELLH